MRPQIIVDIHAAVEINAHCVSGEYGARHVEYLVSLAALSTRQAERDSYLLGYVARLGQNVVCTKIAHMEAYSTGRIKHGLQVW